MAQERLSERFVGYMLASLENAGLTGVYVPHYVLLSAEYGDEFTTPGLVILDEGRANNDGAIWIDGAPDIVFEVVFTDLWLDVMSRRPWYAAAGVAEYWILDADAATLTTLALGPDNQYTERGVLTAADRLTTPLFPQSSACRWRSCLNTRLASGGNAGRGGGGGGTITPPPSPRRRRQPAPRRGGQDTAGAAPAAPPGQRPNPPAELPSG